MSGTRPKIFVYLFAHIKTTEKNPKRSRMWRWDEMLSLTSTSKSKSKHKVKNIKYINIKYVR